MRTEKENTLWLQVKVVPNSSRTGLAGKLGAALKIKVAQPPEEGRANRAVKELLAEIFGIPPSNIRIASGQTRAQKVFQISGLSLEVGRERLAAALGR